MALDIVIIITSNRCGTWRRRAHG